MSHFLLVRAAKHALLHVLQSSKLCCADGDDLSADALQIWFSSRLFGLCTLDVILQSWQVAQGRKAHVITM